MVLLLLTIMLGVMWMAKYSVENVKVLADFMQKAMRSGRPFAFLTGAGCSVTAGIPPAGYIVHEAFQKFGDHIRSKTDSNKWTDYGAVMGCLSAQDRGDIVRPHLENAKLNWGHICLAALMNAGYVGRVLTFNFDSLLAQACALCGFYPATYDFSVSPPKTFDHLPEKSIVHLNGQGHSLVMHNTASQTKKQALRLKPIFADTFQKFGLCAIGYSGTSDEIFPKIKAAYNGQNQLYWCSFGDDDPTGIEQELINKCTSAIHLRGVDFDRFLYDLCCELNVSLPDIFIDPPQYLKAMFDRIQKPPLELTAIGAALGGTIELVGNWSEGFPRNGENRARAVLGGRFDEAIDYGPAITKSDRKILASAWVSKGNRLGRELQTTYREEQFNEAVSFYKRALEASPDHPNAFYNWGVLLTDRARIKKREGLQGEAIKTFEGAAEKFEAADRVAPFDYEVLDSWGSALFDLGLLKSEDLLMQQAIDKFAAALEIRPDADRTYYHWGNTLSGQADQRREKGLLVSAARLYRKAFEKFEAAVKIDPSKHTALFNWGNALLKLAQLKLAHMKGDAALLREAIEKFEAALLIRPDKAEAIRSLLRAKADLDALEKSDTPK